MKKSTPFYERYRIDIKKAPNLVPHPHRFRVKVKKLELAKLLLQELIHYRGNWDVILSRPCLYGVFSGPVGGFSPREELCVGCLRCTVQYPEIVTVSHNNNRLTLGDEFFTPDQVDTIVYEAETGHVPIKGAGYRGKFGGTGWDGMWTDMSEIVRPTRDGIHGREFISTEVDVGGVPPFLSFDKQKAIDEDYPPVVTIPLPLLFDTQPPSLIHNPRFCHILSKAAQAIQTFSILPAAAMTQFHLDGEQIIPLVSTLEEVQTLRNPPVLIEMAKWDEKLYHTILSTFPNVIPILREEFQSNRLISYYQSGIRVFHLTANYHGCNQEGQFVMDLIQEAHSTFVKAGCRDQVTLIGSGGIVAAEHVPKAIICGLDLVALDTTVPVALQGLFLKDTQHPLCAQFQLPKQITVDWGKQRLQNLAGSWHDQLLEILGAMGLREVRRLRGEMGRALFQKELEKEAFAGIDEAP